MRSSPYINSCPTTSSRASSRSNSAAKGARFARNRIQTEVSARTIRPPFAWTPSPPCVVGHRPASSLFREVPAAVHTPHGAPAPQAQDAPSLCRYLPRKPLSLLRRAGHPRSAFSSYISNYHTNMAIPAILYPCQDSRQPSPPNTDQLARGNTSNSIRTPAATPSARSPHASHSLSRTPDSAEPAVPAPTH